MFVRIVLLWNPRGRSPSGWKNKNIVGGEKLILLKTPRETSRWRLRWWSMIEIAFVPTFRENLENHGTLGCWWRRNNCWAPEVDKVIADSCHVGRSLDLLVLDPDWFHRRRNSWIHEVSVGNFVVVFNSDHLVVWNTFLDFEERMLRLKALALWSSPQPLVLEDEIY